MRKFLAAILFLALPAGVHASEVSTTTLDDQSRVSVTAYNQGMALIKESRQVPLIQGKGELRFKDVPSQIMPETVAIQSTGKFKVLEQNYEYDLISQEKILDKYEGKTIKIVEFNEFQDRKNTVEATLLSNQGQIYQIGEEIYLGHPGYKVVPQIPDNLISKPTLMWLYENGGETKQTLDVSYLTGGVSWKADYVLILNEKDTAGDLTGWVTLENQSGATFRDAKLKLVAGDVNVAPQAPMGARFAKQVLYAAAESDASFQEKAFFEYHLYDLTRPTSVKNNQTKQIELLQAQGIVFEKEYTVFGNQNFFNNAYYSQNYPDKKVPVSVYMKFTNSKAGGLGQPLPAGTMRFYKKDADGSQVFIGSDTIRHTPTDEKVRLKLGDAFDVVAERSQKNYQLVTSRVHESEWEIVLRNHKDEAVTVGVLEPFYGSWQITTSSHPFKKENAFSAKASILIPKKGEVKVTYKVRVEF